MPFLYNCRHAGDQYRITKFDSDMNPQGSYLLMLEECECPAGVRPTCRHRQMLPKFIAREHVGDEWFFDFDRGGWVQGEAHWAQQEREPEIELALQTPAFEFTELPGGITVIVMDHPDKVVDVHNAIAEAVGEAHMNITATEIDERMKQVAPPTPDLTEEL